MYKRDTEIRHISSADVFKLGQILEQTNSWKKLMRIIPRNISSSTTSEIQKDDNNLKKYNNDHIRLIENASIKQNRMSTEILFEEWGTSGKKRPTVGNLLELLIEAELFRAADFVALNFLNEPPPERPLKGPAAKIDITLPLLTEDIKDVEKILDGTDYPGTETLLGNAQISSNMNNKDFYQKVIFDDKKLTNNTTNNMTIIMTKQITGSVIVPTVQESDFIKFSSNNINENNTITTVSENNMPILSELVCSTINNDNDSDTTNKKLIEFPLSASSKLPQVIMNVFEEGVMKVETTKESDENHHSNNYETNIDDEMKSNIKDIPMLSVLQYHDNEIDDDNYILPHLSVLNGEGVDYNNDDDVNNDMDIIEEDIICNDNGVAGDAYDTSTTSSSSCCLSNDSNITPNSSASNEDQSSCLNDSSLTTVTETSDDSSFSCDGNKQQQQQQQEIKQSQQEHNEKSEYISSDSNIPCLSALDN